MNDLDHRNIIVVTGTSGGGKSFIISALLKIISQPIEINDLSIIAKMVMQDHIKEGGIHHVHPPEFFERLGVIETGVSRHNHLIHLNHAIGPFIATDQWIPDLTMKEFWYTLAKAPLDTWVIAENARGANLNTPDSPYSKVDVSYARQARFCNSDQLARSSIKRIAGVIRPITDLDLRLERNDRPEEVTKMFGFDDFDTFEPLLKINGVPIITIDNNLERSPEQTRELLEIELRSINILEALTRKPGIEDYSSRGRRK